MLRIHSAFFFDQSSAFSFIRRAPFLMRIPRCYRSAISRKRDEEARGSVCLSVWLTNIRFMRREFHWPVLGSQWVERGEKVGAGDMTLAIEASLLHSSWHVPEVCSGERCKTSQRTAAMEARNKESVAKNGRKTRRLCLFPDKRNHRVLLIACLRA